MQTRQLRLGDVVDDYCPRERRLSNHVIVAIVEDLIKQTRCTTCEFEHPYKEARIPPRRKKQDAPAALYQQVLDGVRGERHMPLLVDPPPSVPEKASAEKLVTPKPVTSKPVAETPVVVEAVAAPVAVVKPKGTLRNGQPASSVSRSSASASPSAADSTVVPDSNESNSGSDETQHVAASDANGNGAPAAIAGNGADEGPVYRRTLIRATLPRPAGETPTRQMPSFTIREAAAARPAKFRQARPHRAARPANGQGGKGGARPNANGSPRGLSRPHASTHPQRSDHHHTSSARPQGGKRRK